MARESAAAARAHLARDAARPNIAAASSVVGRGGRCICPRRHCRGYVDATIDAVEPSALRHGPRRIPQAAVGGGAPACQERTRPEERVVRERSGTPRLWRRRSGRPWLPEQRVHAAPRRLAPQRALREVGETPLPGEYEQDDELPRGVGGAVRIDGQPPRALRDVRVAAGHASAERGVEVLHLQPVRPARMLRDSIGASTLARLDVWRTGSARRRAQRRGRGARPSPRPEACATRRTSSPSGAVVLKVYSGRETGRRARGRSDGDRGGRP